MMALILREVLFYSLRFSQSQPFPRRMELIEGGMPLTTECVGSGNLEPFQPSKYPWLVFVLVIKIGKAPEKE
jgi:hypothetical protein